jgi:hypothetical protein
MGLEWLFLVSFALFVAILAALPDIYALVRDPKRWVPVNPPPYAIGDDYHYYSILNLIHRRFLNAFSGKNLDILHLSSVAKLQIVGFLFNIPPYHIGYMLHDRRLGILFVRIWNTTWLMLALMVCAKLLFGALQLEASPVLLAFSALAFFATYPLPWLVSWSNSIWLNLSRKNHIFFSSSANDLQRAMHMATSGHLLLWASALLIWSFSRGDINNNIYLIPLSVGMLLFITYFPAAFIYGFIYFVGLVADHKFLFAGGWLLIFMGLTALYLRTFFNDAVGKEVFVPHDSGGKIFAVNRKKLVIAAIVLLLPLACYALFKDTVTEPVFWVLFFGSGAFVVTPLIASHQGNRFWQRGAIVIYQLFIVVIGFALLVQYVPFRWKWVLGNSLIFLVIALSLYFYRNAVFLYDIRSTRSPNWIDAQQLSRDFHSDSKLFATDSVEMGFYIYLYTGDSCLLKHYSIQNQGYKKHLGEFCLNFKILGYELSELLDLFSRQIKQKDWVSKRMDVAHNPDAADLARLYTLQFMATYMGFNQRILDDQVFDKNGWNDRAREMITTIWHDIETRTVPTATILCDPDDGLRVVLKVTSK